MSGFVSMILAKCNAYAIICEQVFVILRCSTKAIELEPNRSRGEAGPNHAFRLSLCRRIVSTGKVGCVLRQERYILGIDPGLANTGWGVVCQRGSRLSCVAYGCISSDTDLPLEQRLLKICQQIGAVVARFEPCAVGVETVWFGQNITAAFATGQARGAALVACAQGGLEVGEYTPKQIKMAVVGTGAAEKEQVQYMVQQILGLEQIPKPDHAADALAAAICYTTHNGRLSGK